MNKMSMLTFMSAAALLGGGGLPAFPEPRHFRKRRTRKLTLEQEAAYVADVVEKKIAREHRRLNAASRAAHGEQKQGKRTQPYLWGIGGYKEWCSVTRPDPNRDGFARVLVTFDVPVTASEAKHKLLEVAPDLDGRMLAVVPNHIHVS